VFSEILTDHILLFQHQEHHGHVLLYSLTQNCIPKNLPIQTNAMQHHCSLKDYDEDHIILPQKYDAIISVLSLHYSNDIVGSLIQYKRHLQDGGKFLAIIFGGETLAELKHCLIEMDEQKFGKVYPRVMPMINPQIVPSLMQRSGYKNPIISVEKVFMKYKNLKTLCNDIKNIGQLNYLNNRSNVYVGKDYFSKVEELYFKCYQQNNQILATFEFIIIHAEA
jgi:NADH dehydrogenase [ubiquinone] 1 alpha subcomplex assembly factor 5